MEQHENNLSTAAERFEMSTSSKRVGNGRAFGTFGELLQGVRGSNDLDFLVTFPIDRFAHAVFTVETESHELTVSPSYKKKAKRIAELILTHFDLPLCGHLEIGSEIPVGKGLASSSADLVATARAVSACYELELDNELLQSFMAEIEPSDGVMYPGVVSFYHRQVKLCEMIGQMPNLTVVSIDEGGEVDTVEFNKIPKPFSPEDKQEYCHLLNTATEAIRQGDVRTIGQVATRSAVLNQKLRPKRHLDAMIELCEEVGGTGVLVAHSGTCAGILLWPEDPRYDEQLHIVCQRLRLLSNDVMIYHSWSDTSVKEGIGY